MMALTADMSNLIAIASVTVCLTPFLSMGLASLLWRQLRTLGWLDEDA